MISSGILDGSTPNFSKILTAFPLSCIVQKTACHWPKNCHRSYLLQTRPLWGEPTRCEQYQWCSRSASWLLPPKQAGLFHEQAWSNTGFGSPWNRWPRHTIAQYTLCGWGERDLHWDHASTTANHLFHRLAGFLLMTLLFMLFSISFHIAAVVNSPVLERHIELFQHLSWGPTGVGHNSNQQHLSADIVVAQTPGLLPSDPSVSKSD